MLCFVLRGDRDTIEAVRDHLTRPQTASGLNRLFGELKAVHFASIALLPGHGPADQDDRDHLRDPTPSVMLELVVDDGVSPESVIDQLVDQGIEQLWPFFHGASPPAPTDFEAARRQLRGLLLARLPEARAAGGFIGMRDRTATQVCQELAAFTHARECMRQLRAERPGSGPPLSSQQWVGSLLDKLAEAPAEPALQAPPPQSFWPRQPSGPVKLLLALLWVGMPVPAVVIALAAIGAVAHAVLLPWPALAAGWLAGTVAGGVLALAALGACALLRTGRFSQGTLGLALSVAGIAGMLALLLNALLQQARSALGGSLPEPAIALLVLAGLALLWSAWKLVLQTMWPRGAGQVGVVVLGLGFAGLALAATDGYFSSLWHQLLAAGAVGALCALLLRTRVLRWWAVLAWWVVPGASAWALWVAMGPASATAQIAPMALWTPAELSAYFWFGVLSVLCLALAAGSVLALTVLRALRRPWWPLAPLTLALVVLLPMGALLLGRVGMALLGSLGVAGLSTPQGLGSPRWAMGWSLVALLAMAALVAACLRTVADSHLPKLARLTRRLDRPPRYTDDFKPVDVPASILANEAAQSGKTKHMINLCDVRGRPGGWRARMLRLWLNIIGDAGHAWYTQGWLGDAWGIKFGHWHLIDGGRRLLFVSNFDGDFGGYLDEFIRGTSQGINLIWGWTTLKPRPAAAAGEPEVKIGRRFPSTTAWAFRGCHRELHFKAYARAGMVPHLYLYQAYDHASTTIRRATRLRELLAGPRTAASDDEVMRILES